MEHQQRVIADQVINREDELQKESRFAAAKVTDTEQRRAATAKELQGVYQSLWRAESKADLNLQLMVAAFIWAFISTGFLVYTL